MFIKHGSGEMIRSVATEQLISYLHVDTCLQSPRHQSDSSDHTTIYLLFSYACHGRIFFGGGYLSLHNFKDFPCFANHWSTVTIAVIICTDTYVII